MNVGFTGTRTGMTNAQLSEVRKILELEAMDISVQHEFHHGNCVGADEQAAAIAKELGYKVIAHPSTITGMNADCVNDVELPAKPPLERNQVIVDACDVLLATPKSSEQVRSGTWATVRYADSVHNPVVIITPAGDVT